MESSMPLGTKTNGKGIALQLLLELPTLTQKRGLPATLRTVITAAPLAPMARTSSRFLLFELITAALEIF